MPYNSRSRGGSRGDTKWITVTGLFERRDGGFPIQGSTRDDVEGPDGLFIPANTRFVVWENDSDNENAPPFNLKIDTSDPDERRGGGRGRSSAPPRGRGRDDDRGRSSGPPRGRGRSRDDDYDSRGRERNWGDDEPPPGDDDVPW